MKIKQYEDGSSYLEMESGCKFPFKKDLSPEDINQTTLFLQVGDENFNPTEEDLHNYSKLFYYKDKENSNEASQSTI